VIKCEVFGKLSCFRSLPAAHVRTRTHPILAVAVKSHTPTLLRWRHFITSRGSCSTPYSSELWMMCPVCQLFLVQRVAYVHLSRPTCYCWYSSVSCSNASPQCCPFRFELGGHTSVLHWSVQFLEAVFCDVMWFLNQDSWCNGYVGFKETIALENVQEVSTAPEL